MLKEKLSKYIIDKSKPEWKIRFLNVSGQEVEIPDAFNGEILLETVIGKDGRCRGWITISPEKLEEMFKEAIEEHKKTGKPLGQCLLEHNDIHEEVDLSKPIEDETIRILKKTFPVYPIDILITLPLYESIYQNIEIERKKVGALGVIKITIGEKIRKEYIEKWMEEGLL